MTILGAAAKRDVKIVPTARDYVQDGLIAMWDGIENAGWGMHDDAATVWKDLVGSLDWTLDGSAYKFAKNSLSSASNTGKGVLNAGTMPSYATLEICYNASSGSRFLMDTDTTNLRYAIISSTGNYIQTTNNRALVKDDVGGDMYGFHTVAFSYSENTPSSCAIDGEVRALVAMSNSWTYAKWALGSSGINGSYRGYIGDIHSVRMYGAQLTADEIAANYAVDKARFNLEG